MDALFDYAQHLCSWKIVWDIFVFFSYNLTFTMLTRARTSDSRAYVAVATVINVFIFFLSFDILFQGGRINWRSFPSFLFGNTIGNAYGVTVSRLLEKKFRIFVRQDA